MTESRFQEILKRYWRLNNKITSYESTSEDIYDFHVINIESTINCLRFTWAIDLKYERLIIDHKVSVFYKIKKDVKLTTNNLVQYLTMLESFDNIKIANFNDD